MPARLMTPTKSLVRRSQRGQIVFGRHWRVHRINSALRSHRLRPDLDEKHRLSLRHAGRKSHRLFRHRVSFLPGGNSRHLQCRNAYADLYRHFGRVHNLLGLWQRDDEPLARWPERSRGPEYRGASRAGVGHRVDRPRTRLSDLEITVMMLPEEGDLLRIFIGESDKHNGKLLYEWIVMKAREEGLAGATGMRGMMGFGAHSRLHTSKIEPLSQHLQSIFE